MKKSYLASLAGFLLAAGAALGQAPQLPPPAPAPHPPEKLPAPEKLPDLGPAPAPAPAPAFPEEYKPFCLPEPGPTRGAIFTTDAEYVLWFFGDPHDTLPVATTAPFGSPNGTTVLGAVGDADQQKRGPFSGFRVGFGYWQLLDDFWVPGGLRDYGAEATFFVVPGQSAGFVDSNSPTIVRPFFEANTLLNGGFIVAEPGLATGALLARARADVWGAEANAWKNLYYNSPGTTFSVSALGGFRYLSLDESLDIASVSVFERNLAAFPGFGPFAGNTLRVADSFGTHNRFYGAQGGVNVRWWPIDEIVFEWDAKLGLGVTDEDLRITGGQQRTLANGTQITSPAGLLALPSNSGTFHRDKFSQVLDLEFKVEVPITNYLTFTTSFTSLLWTRTLRAAEQVDSSLDVRQVPNFPGAASAPSTALTQPGAFLKQSEFWLLGINFAFEVVW